MLFVQMFNPTLIIQDLLSVEFVNLSKIAVTNLQTVISVLLTF